MARKEINNIWDSNMRIAIDQNFIELYSMRDVLQKQINDMIIESGTSDAETIQARGEFPVLNERLNNYNERITDAIAKSNNPLGSMQANNQRITLDLLSDEVKDAMSGTTEITTAKGYLENNRGVVYPLKNVTRDGVVHNVSEKVKNAVLDAKVTNAKKDKIYVLAYISKGVNDSYGITVNEYDKDTFATNSSSSEVRLVYYNRDHFKTPVDGITHITAEDENGNGIIFDFVIDFSLITGTNLNIANTSNGEARSTIIDESKYVYRTEMFADNQAKNSLPLVCSWGANKASIKFAYSQTQNMILEFGLLGINQITHLTGIFLQNRPSVGIGADFTNKELFYNASSDWISPYRIRAINNGNSNGYITTGGNHGTEGSGGFPTARRVSTAVYADNKEVRSGDVVFVKDKVVIRTTNRIAAMNTIDLTTGEMREVLEEIVTYTITPENVSVTVEFEALEDIEIRDYSGIQAQKGSWAQNLYFFADPNKPVIYSVSGDGTGSSSTKSQGNPDRWVMKKDGNISIAYYDTSVGLGKRENVTDNEELFWHTATKVYGKLIYMDGAYIPLNKGDSLYWTGGYVFTRGLICPGAETAYFYYLSGKKVYVVDFFNAADTHLAVELNDINKKITVIEKSDSITCDDFISSKGLKISAEGYGQLKFSVD